MLIVMPKSLLACENLSMSLYSCCSVREAMAASSAKSKFLMIVSCTLVLALRMKRLNSFLSDPVHRKTSSVDAPKARFSMTAKKMPKSVRASTHPCFTPLQMLKAPEVAPSNHTTPLVSVWKDCITLSSLGGHLILARTRKRPSQLTRLKALVRSINAIKSARLFSLRFSWSWRREKTTSIAEHFALKPH